MNKVWKKNRAKYGSGEELWIGRRCVGCWFNPVVSRGSEALFRAQTHLPSIAIRTDLVDSKTAEGAKAVVEAIVDAWFKGLEDEA